MNKAQLAIHANTVLELTRQRLVADSIKRNAPDIEGLDIILGMADIRATDLLMIRNLV